MSGISKALFWALGVTGFKSRVDFLHPRRSKKAKKPAMPKKYYKETVRWVNQRLVCTVTPIGAGAQTHVIFFHGGGYSQEASGLHFSFMKKLIRQTKCTLTYVDYPLAPEHSVTDTMAMCRKTYDELKTAYPDHRFIFMGDSAGGGLALALAMLIRDQELVGPEKLILFSPWIDIGMTNKEIPNYQDRDVVLDVTALQGIAERYRGSLPNNHPLVSPKYGDLHGLGQLSVFYGTEELLCPDCRELCDQNLNGGIFVQAYEYQGMQHDWVILPIPEAIEAMSEAGLLVTEILET